MYRPNRIGPWPHWNSNKAAWTNAATDATVIGGTGVASIFPQIESTVLDSKGQMQLLVAGITIQQNEYVSYGVPISSDYPIGTTKMQISISGAFTWMDDGYPNSKAVVFPFLARPKSATLVADDTTKTNECDEWLMLPFLASSKFGVSVNCSVLVEDTSENTKPFIAGYIYQTGYSNGAVTAIQANIYVEKYVDDTVIFDPNR